MSIRPAGRQTKKVIDPMRRFRRPSVQPHPRRGLSSLEYVLVLTVVLSLVLIMLRSGIGLIRVVYEMMCAMVAWPFL